MAASDDIKEQIVHHYKHTGAPTNIKDWKRLSKSTVGSDIVRVFENKVAGLTCSITGDDEVDGLFEHGEWIYGIGQMDPNDPAIQYVPSQMYICFSPRRYWDAVGYIPDRHLAHVLKLFHNLPADIAAEEDMENSFSVPANYNSLTIHMALKKAGFTFDQAFNAFIQPGANRGTNNSGSTSNTPAGGHYGTGLTVGQTKPSDFVFAVMKQTGQKEVEVMITAYQDFLHEGGFDQEISTLVEPHLPSDWDEASEQCFNPGKMTAAEAYDYLINAGFVHDSKYADGFVDSGHYYVEYVPEKTLDHSNQPQSVQDALEAQHAKGELGLPKAGAHWLEDHEITTKYEDDDEEEFELERSQVIYLLYSIYDDGCHEEIPDFFSFSNAELGEAIGGVIDGPDFLVLPDNQAYAAPYDIPEPVTSSTNNSAIQAKIAQLAGQLGVPVSIGGHTFAPPANSGPGLITPAVPVLTESEVTSVRIKASPEQWPEFCNEIWQAWNANTEETLKIEWVDNYRYREATIVGLGFQFKVLEYTGIEIYAGYILEKTGITDQFDVPSEVFQELFSELGGNWNIGESRQFINKRKGEDADGFSYSSSELWDEVKPILEKAGWIEVA